MNTRYCANVSCGKKNEYTAVKPTFCSACGKPFSQAFATVSTPVAPIAGVERIYDAQGNDITDRYQPNKKVVTAQPRPGRRRHGQAAEIEEPGQEATDIYDENEMLAEADQLAASIRGSIHIGFEDNEKPNTIRLGDLPNIVQAATAASDASASPKNKRRARK